MDCSYTVQILDWKTQWFGTIRASHLGPKSTNDFAHKSGLFAAGQPPPIEAFGAVIEGYAKQRDAEAALAVLKTFFEQGGEADGRMYDLVVDVCVRAHKFQRALQVGFLAAVQKLFSEHRRRHHLPCFSLRYLLYPSRTSLIVHIDFSKP